MGTGITPSRPRRRRKTVSLLRAFGGVAREAKHTGQERPRAPAGKQAQPSPLDVIDGDLPGALLRPWPRRNR